MCPTGYDPGILYKADVMLLTRIDLLPHLEFDDALTCENTRQIRPDGRGPRSLGGVDRNAVAPASGGVKSRTALPTRCCEPA